jgi:hypothetical protein
MLLRARSGSFRRTVTAGLFALIAVPVVALGVAYVEEFKSGIPWPEPAVIDPGPVGGPPSDAIRLFDGASLDAWNGGQNWTIADGVCWPTGKGGLTTKDAFGDVQLHLEFATPAEVKGNGQGRGNSGVYFMGRYEVQVLDSYENQTYFDGQCASIYKQKPPLVNACRKPGEWQTYDILFTAPRFDERGQLLRPAAVTVLHNGVAVHNHFELLGDTAYDRPPSYTAHDPVGQIHIQDHGNPVRFRNIWVRPLVEPALPQPADTAVKK